MGSKNVASPSFWERVEKTSDCWIWIGPRTSTGPRAGTGGYGKWGTTLSHRISYEALVGPIPPGLQLDHLCETPPCVNPEHLEPVTGLENIRRWQERNPFCAKGHALVGDNLRIGNFKSGRRRICRTCTRRTNRLAQQRKKQRLANGDPASLWLVVEEVA